MPDSPQELMTPKEAARWFRRSTCWLRRRRQLLRLGTSAGAPLYHVRACRAFLIGSALGLSGEELRRFQLAALSEVCGLPPEQLVRVHESEALRP